MPGSVWRSYVITHAFTWCIVQEPVTAIYTVPCVEEGLAVIVEETKFKLVLKHPPFVVVPVS